MYRTADGMVVIATANDSLFRRLAGVMGRPDLPDDPRFSTNPSRKAHEKEIDAIVEQWTQGHSTVEVERLLDEVGVPVAAARSVEQLVEDPQLLHREMIVEHEVPGVGWVKFPANPLRLQLTPPDPSRRAPELGEHTAEILSTVLHYSDAQIRQMRENQAI